MPIIALPHVAPPIVIEDVGFWSATWYAPDGSSWPLTDEDAGWWTIADDISGLGAADIEITRDRRPRRGIRVRHKQPLERTITWPLRVEGEDHMEFVHRWRAVMRAFTSTTQLGPGWLELARPDGTARRIQAHYQEGFDHSGAAGSGITHDHAVLSLLCEDPYWQDATQITIPFEYSSGAVDYQNPYPTVSPASTLGEQTVFNPSDVDADIEWTITGPATLVTATLGSQSWTLNPNAPSIGHGPLLAGQQVTLSTYPPRVRYSDGSVWTGALNWPGARLWPLPPGSSDIDLVVTGANTGTLIEMRFRPVYEAA